MLAVLSGLLLWACWPVSPFTFFVFVALVPFLWLADVVTRRLTFFYCTYCMLLIWNAATTWWIINSTVPGGIAAILANSFLMSIPLMGYYAVKKRAGETRGYVALVVFWLTFEYVHLNWQLSWPWLTLGNVFALHPGWVQWYEYTGTSGGTLWVMVVNILLFILLKNRKAGPAFNPRRLLVTGLALFIPFVISYFTQTKSLNAASADKNVVVVQPNIDPYKKFTAGNEAMQLQQLIRLSEQQADTSTAMVVWPETAINQASGIDEAKLHDNIIMLPVWAFLKRHPHLKLLTGIESFRVFSEPEKSATAKRIAGTDQFYDSYNTAALLDSTGPLQFYHKSKFVPGVETIPSYLWFIASWFEQFGGTASGYAPQEERTVLTDPQSGYRIAPAICYESIYGEFLTAYIRNGANVIAIITNDGWWANTSGHKQHMAYACLRAIECRRWIVRSANTGISCFISPAGDIFNRQPWDTAAAIKMNIPTSSYLTFYVRYGDIISKAAAGISILLLLESIIAAVHRKVNKKQY